MQECLDTVRSVHVIAKYTLDTKTINILVTSKTFLYPRKWRVHAGKRKRAVLTLDSKREILERLVNERG